MKCPTAPWTHAAGTWVFEVPRAAMTKDAAWRRCVRSGQRIGIPAHAWLKDHSSSYAPRAYGPACTCGSYDRDPYCPVGDDIGQHPIGTGRVWRWYTDTDDRIAVRGEAAERHRAARFARAAELRAEREASGARDPWLPVSTS